MSYYRFTRLQQYINGQPTDVYAKGERVDDVDYSTYESCMGSSADTRWVSIPQTVCYNGDLWSMEKEQISYDGGTSWSDTGNSKRASVIEQSSAQCFMNDWRVVPGEYICMMHAKWTKEAEYVSYDGGQTWTATGNIRRGETVIELLSADCGVIYQWIPTGEYICQGYNKYMKEKQVYSTDNGSTWTDTDNRRTGGLVEADSPYCGYEQYIYQWVDVAGEYVCQETTKYKKQKEQRSSDNGQTWEDTGNTRQGEVIEVNSFDCGYVAYRWVSDTGYVCVGYDKYNKEKEQSTTDGINWIDTGNTRTGSLIESDSEDCGYDPSHDYSTEYLTIESLGSGNIRLKKNDESKTPLSNIQYSKNNGAWTSYRYGTKISLNNGDKIRWKAIWNDGNELGLYTDSYSYFDTSSAFNIKVYGNPISLLVNDSFANVTDISSFNAAFSYLFKKLLSHLTDASNLSLVATTLSEGCYAFMFNGCTSLTTAPVLPATTLSTDCYQGMFFNCTSLTTAPVLPATTLSEGCYAFMFNGCSSLTSAPVLPATTLAKDCYGNMFAGCSSLTTAPVLPATTLPDVCYAYMFENCTSLTTAPALPATTLASRCYISMFWGCTSLTTAPVLPATTLAEGCYGDMFAGCSSLTSAPALPATILTDYCYQYMFEDCTSLTAAPVLPAEILAQYCYNKMFYGCTSLNSVTCCATDISASNCTNEWLYNVAATGTFNKDANTTWPTGTSGIPSGWTTDTCGCESDYSRVYLTTEALESGNISLNKEALEDYQDKYPLTNIQYSKNNGSWTPYTYNTLISVVNGDKIKWKAQWNDGVSFFMYRNTFKSTGRYKAYGNPLSLLLIDNFSGVTSLAGYGGAFAGLFLGEEKLTDVSDISLPATTLSYECYTGMFQGCRLITSAPELPATIVAYDCYMQMFADCTSLTDAPVLPATKLAISSYYSMFLSCTSLKHVKCYATNIKALNCTEHWLNGVSSTGTFTKAAGASWKTGESGIPEGWTVVEAS